MTQSEPFLGKTDTLIPPRDVTVEMRDGVRLATRVYLPGEAHGAARGRFPTLVERTPYGREFAENGAAHAAYFTPRGYAVVVQDVRGRFGSEGQWRPMRDDGADGADLLAWIAAQPWSDGKVGTFGTSYPGGTQHALAMAGAPQLAAMVPVDAMGNAGRQGMRNGGAFELRWLNWVLTLGMATNEYLTPDGRRTGPIADVEGEPKGRYLLQDGRVGTPEDDPTLKAHLAGGRAAVARAAADPAARKALAALADQVRTFAERGKIEAGATDLRFAPELEAWLVEALAHAENDAFWTDMGIAVVEHVGAYQDVPVLHVTGAYDSWAGPVANLTYPALVSAKQAPQRLLFGPWTHGRQAQSFSGMAEFGPDAAVDMLALEARWFDRWLKGARNGVEGEPPVRLFVMGGGDGHRTPEGRVFVGGRWRDEAAWPLARAVPTAFHLHAGGELSSRTPADSPPSAYRFDPLDPVPTLGGNVSSEGDLMLRGAQDQRCRADLWPCRADGPLADRQDVLVFQTAPLEEAVEAAGPIMVKLWAASDGPDTDFTAKLVDVWPRSADFPAGLALNITDGIIRARHRDAPAPPSLLEPGRLYEFTITLYPTAVLFPCGHRIRIDISSSNFPRFDVNPNTAAAADPARVAVNTIFHDDAHPSHVLLPLVPPTA